MKIILHSWWLILLLNSSSSFASHSFAGLDMCALYPEVMPPGLMPEQLPDADSQGAALMQQYCTQCHALPGPGRHTADEWPVVLDHMFTIMDVADKFSGLLGNVKTPATGEREQIRGYLDKYALKPMTIRPQGAGASAFESHCSGCHALPDPSQYRRADWPELIKRMQHNMTVMKYTPPSSDVLMQIQLYIQSHTRASDAGEASMDNYLTTNINSDSVQWRDRSFSSASWLALGPFFVLVIIGLVRWRNNHRHIDRSSGIKQIKA